MMPPGFQKYDLRDISNILVEDLDRLPEHSANLVISGSANYHIWEPAAPHIEKASSERNCKFKFLVGPIISADEDGKSALIELANKRHIELYVSYRRQGMNGRVFSLGSGYEMTSGTYLWSEASHEPLESSRVMRRFEASHGRGSYEIQDFMVRFKFFAFANSRYYPKSVRPEEDFLVLKESEIKRVVERHNERICPFNFMSRPEMEQCLAEQGANH